MVHKIFREKENTLDLRLNQKYNKGEMDGGVRCG